VADAPAAGPRASGLALELAAAFPADLLRTADADRARYETDHRKRYHGRALAIALPRTTADVSRLLAWCNARRVGVVPQGGNTGYCGGATPDDSGTQLVLSLERMRQVRGVDAANLSMTVEAGCLLVEVQAAAAAAGCCFPLELGSAGSCQIGGNLATNAGGMNVLRYGMTRSLVLGIEAVLADGRVYEGLRALRKDNTGYDLRSLLVGSEGTLGVITAATLRLWPARRSTAMALVALPSPSAALALLGMLRSRCEDRLESFELLPRIALELVRRQIPGTAAPFAQAPPWSVVCELASAAIEPLGELLQAALADALAAGIATDAVLATSESQRLALWAVRESVPEAQRRGGPGLRHDISVPVASIPRFIEEAGAGLAHLVPNATLVGYGHLGDGNLHFNLNWFAGAAPGEVEAMELPVRRYVHDLVASYGGSFSAEHGVGQSKRDELARYGSPVGLAMMRAIKQAFDPNGIMNPGKLLAP